MDFEASAVPDITHTARARGPGRFAVIFGACFLLGFGVVMLPPVQVVDAGFSRALVALAHKLIRICGGNARAEGAILWAPSGFGVEMKACRYPRLDSGERSLFKTADLLWSKSG